MGEVDRVCDRVVFMNEGHKIADETAAEVTRRAARIVRVTWAAGQALDGVEQRLRGNEVEQLRLDGQRLTVHLSTDDPRPFLARLAREDDLPPPLSVEHGHLSLQQLYQSLYGVEGT